MKAIVVRRFGGPEVLVVEEAPVPRPAAGQLLVRLHAAGVNPVETYIRSGAYDPLPDLPYTPGGDGAGVVAAVGEGLEGFAEGQRVYVSGCPSYAEYALCPGGGAHQLPDDVSFAQGAALGVPYATALRALDLAAAQAGDLVLVHGGSGGVGTAAVQICRGLGLPVAATASTAEGLELLAAMGAVAVGHGEYGAARAAFGGRGFDVILEMAADRNLAEDLRQLAPGGTVVVVGSRGPTEINARDLMRSGGAVRGLLLFQTPAAALRRIHLRLGAALAAGWLRPVIGQSFPLAEAPAAHRAVMAPGAVGKIVLEI